MVRCCGCVFRMGADGRELGMREVAVPPRTLPQSRDMTPWRACGVARRASGGRVVSPKRWPEQNWGLFHLAPPRQKMGMEGGCQVGAPRGRRGVAAAYCRTLGWLVSWTGSLCSQRADGHGWEQRTQASLRGGAGHCKCVWQDAPLGTLENVTGRQSGQFRAGLT